MDRLTQDVRLALRMIARAPGFATVAILTLAFGIGSTTAVFSVVDGAILRPFPYPDMHRLMLLTESGQNNQTMSVSWPNFVDWREQADAFQELGVFRGMTVNYLGAGGTERLNASLASSSVFQSIGIPPLEGRLFVPADDAPGAAAVAIVSERFRRSHFGAGESPLDREIRLDGRVFTIVGVVPASLRFPSRLTDVWVPLGLFVDEFPGRGAHPGLTAVGRLKDGVTVESARTTMSAIAERLAAAYPNSNRFNTVVVTPYYELVVGEIRPAMMVLLAAVGLLLLVTCVNLANLLLARAEARQQELTIRAALGAGRPRLVRQLLTEALVLAGMGGALGVLLAHWGVAAFVASGPTTIPRIDLVGVDLRALGVAVAATMATGVLFGLAPAIRTSRPDLHAGVKAGARSSVGSGSTRFRSLLVTAELALATILLISAALLVKSYSRLILVDLGFDPSRVVTMRLSLPQAAYPSQDAWTAFHSELLSRLSVVSGLEAIGLSSSVPLGGGVAESSMRREGEIPSPDRPATMCAFSVVSEEYFSAMGIGVVRGRAFDRRDSATSTPVAIVDDEGAAALFPGQDPIGRRIAFETRSTSGGPPEPIWREIVGVVRHVRSYGLSDEPAFVQVFTPLLQLPTYLVQRRPAMALAIRTSGAPESAMAAVRSTVKDLDVGIPVFGLRTMQSVVDRASEQPRLNASMIGLFATLSLVLALVGVYGVLAYDAARRTREIGLRVALGATRADIVRLLGWQAMRLVVLGLTLGALGAVVLTRLLSRMLIGVSPTDPSAFVLVILSLALCALLASAVPLRRASRIDPAAALRGQ